MYIIESDYRHIETHESTAIKKENDVYQYHYDSPPIEGHFLRLDEHQRLDVRKVIKNTEDETIFVDNSLIEYTWKKA